MRRNTTKLSNYEFKLKQEVFSVKKIHMNDHVKDFNQHLQQLIHKKEGTKKRSSCLLLC